MRFDGRDGSSVALVQFAPDLPRDRAPWVVVESAGSALGELLARVEAHASDLGYVALWTTDDLRAHGWQESDGGILQRPLSLDLDAWEAWHPTEIAELLAGAPVRWHVAGGWALDVWHGRQTRPHADLEIAVPHRDYAALLPHLGDVTPYAAGPEPGKLRRLAPGEAPHPEVHQVWMRDDPAGVWRTDVFLEPGDDQTWVCRRDPRLRLPYDTIVDRSADGVPYLRPEAVLLFKAKASRPKDVGDFERALPHLDAAQREWLTHALTTVHPGHGWLSRLR
jgi:hypothetical protein